MNQTDRLERELTAWLSDTAVPRPRLHRTTSSRRRRTRQRPALDDPRKVAPHERHHPRPADVVGPLASIAVLTALLLAAGRRRRLRRRRQDRARTPARALRHRPERIHCQGAGRGHRRWSIRCPGHGRRSSAARRRDWGPHLFSRDGTRLAFTRDWSGGGRWRRQRVGRRRRRSQPAQAGDRRAHRSPCGRLVTRRSLS